MIINYFANSKKNIMSDLYIDTINNYNNKSQHIVVLPNVSSEYKIASGFAEVITEKISCGNIYQRIIEMIKLNKKLFKLCKTNKVDKVFFCDEVIFNIAIIFIIKYFKLDVYMWVHDPENHSGERIKKKIGRKLIDKLIIKNSKKIFVTYKEAKLQVANKYNIPLNKIEVIWLPEVKTMEFKEIKDSKNSFKYDFIFFGRIEKYKGIDIYIDSITKIINNYGRNINALIVGTGSESKNVTELIKKTNNEKNIIFINRFVEDKELAQLISLSKIVVLPYKDATGTQTIQVANYYNKPVVVNSVGCFKEYVKNNKNGIVVKNMTSENLSRTLVYLNENNEIYNKIIINMDSYFNEKFGMKKFIHSIESNLSST